MRSLLLRDRMMPRLSPVHIVRLTQVGSLKIRFRPSQVHEARHRRVNSALRMALVRLVVLTSSWVASRLVDTS